MITLDDAHRILAAVAAFDRRTLGEVDAHAWMAAINHSYPDMRMDDALAGVVAWHATAEEGWMRPAHLIANAKRIARERIARSPAQHASGCWGLPANSPLAQPITNALPAARKGHTPAAVAAIAAIRKLAKSWSVPGEEPAEVSRSELIRQRAINRKKLDERR